MRSAILLGAAALVAASPAPQAIDLDAVHNAPAPTGPALGVHSQDHVYNTASASVSATAAVTGVASAPATVPEKRSLEARTMCLFGFIGNCPKPSSQGSQYPSPPQTSSGVPMTTAKSVQPTTSTSAATTPVTTPPPPTSTGLVPSTCTPVSWTNTFAMTTASGCPTPFEVGTFCGFINPEDPCAPQPDGYGPVATPDTVAAFIANPALHQMANSAKDPQGYAATFKDKNASVNANTYLGFETLKSYDVQSCASKCNSIDLCTSFNIFIERDPAWNGEQCSCPMPDSITNYKCSFWGSGVTPEAANNFGQTRGQDGFQVVITGSNGYTKVNATTPVTPAGCTKPIKCGAVHDHPRTCLAQHFFPGPFDVSLCATYAKAQNGKNAASGFWSKWSSALGYNPGKCNFFNAFMIKENGVAKGTYCKLFAQQYEASAATYQPGFQGSYKYEIESSWTYNFS